VSGGPSRVALVTGASSGIGAALARRLVRDGYALGLVARRESELRALQSEITSAGGCAAIAVADVSSRTEMTGAVQKIATELGPVDLFVGNAGIAGPTRISPLNIDDIDRIFAVNVHGLLYGIEAVLPEMLERKSGHIVGISSVAAYFTFPGESAYCASKAAVNSFLAGLRGQLAPRGISVTTICPGFIRTPLVKKNKFKMPFLMEADEAADRIARAIARRAGVYDFPWQTRMMVAMCNLLPASVLRKMAKRD